MIISSIKYTPRKGFIFISGNLAGAVMFTNTLS